MSGCGFVTKQKGKEVLCGRPCSAWRWYQNDARHDTGLVAVCDWHGNEGGRRMQALEARVDGAHAEGWQSAVNWFAQQGPLTGGPRVGIDLILVAEEANPWGAA